MIGIILLTVRFIIICIMWSYLIIEGPYLVGTLIVTALFLAVEIYFWCDVISAFL